MNNVVEIIVQAVDRVSETFDNIKTRGVSMSQEMEANFIKVGVALTGVGIACKLAADNINNAYVSFENSIAQVKSLGAATNEEMEAIQQAALDISSTMPISAKEVADGFYMMQSAGYSAQDAINGMGNIAKMAVGGQLELADAVNATTMVLDVYGDRAGGAEHITDVLMGTVAGFKTTLPQLQQELSKCIGPAAGLGISFEELSAMAGMLKKDFTSAEEAGTALKTMFLRLSDPKVVEMLESMGIQVKDATGNFVGMDSILDQLNTTLDSYGGNVDRNGALTQIFGTEGFRAADSLLRQRSEMGGYVDKLKEGGQAQEAFNAMIETTGSKLEIANNKMENAKIALGEAMAPATMLAADAMSKLAGVLTSLPEPLQAIAGSFLIFGQSLAVIGPLLIALPAILGVVGPAMTLLSGVIGGVSAAIGGAGASAAVAGTTLGALGVTIGTLILPLGAVIAAVIAFKLAWDNNFLGIRDKAAEAAEFIKERWAGVKSAFAGMAEEVAPHFEKLKMAFTQLALNLDETFKKLTGGIGITEVLGKAFELLGRIFDDFVTHFVDGLVWWIDLITDGITAAVEWISKLIDWFNRILENPIAQFLIEKVGGAFDYVGQKLDGILPKTKNTATDLTTIKDKSLEIGPAAETGFGKLSAAAGTAEQKVHEVAVKIGQYVDGIKQDVIQIGTAAEGVAYVYNEAKGYYEQVVETAPGVYTTYENQQQQTTTGGTTGGTSGGTTGGTTTSTSFNPSSGYTQITGTVDNVQKAVYSQGGRYYVATSSGKYQEVYDVGTVKGVKFSATAPSGGTTTTPTGTTGTAGTTGTTGTTGGTTGTTGGTTGTTGTAGTTTTTTGTTTSTTGDVYGTPPSPYPGYDSTSTITKNGQSVRVYWVGNNGYIWNSTQKKWETYSTAGTSSSSAGTTTGSTGSSQPEATNPVGGTTSTPLRAYPPGGGTLTQIGTVSVRTNSDGTYTPVSYTLYGSFEGYVVSGNYYNGYVVQSGKLVAPSAATQTTATTTQQATTQTSGGTSSGGSSGGATTQEPAPAPAPAPTPTYMTMDNVDHTYPQYYSRYIGMSYKGQQNVAVFYDSRYQGHVYNRITGQWETFVPGLQMGGEILEGGMVVVGEGSHPELVSLPKGATVTPLKGGEDDLIEKIVSRILAAIGGNRGGGDVHFHGLFIVDRAGLLRLNQELRNLDPIENARRGMI
jgi:TP901 family phage tail tape measure protein